MLAQVPDLHDFVGGIRVPLAPGGVATVEIPHLVRLIEENQFDTIYHEHFSYFSLLTVRLLAAHGLQLFDVEELPSHGGSLRILPTRGDRTLAVAASRARRARARRGYDSLRATRVRAPGRRDQVATARAADRAPREGKRIAGYGAPGKGNTLLNYCGIRDRSPRVHRRPQPVQAGQVPARDAIPIHPDTLEPDRPTTS